MSWQDIQGHTRQVEAFARTYARGRLAHAYLLAGPAGVGKGLFARELARALLCEGRASDVLAACDRCASCRLVGADTHPDLMVVGRAEGKFQLPIETIRGVCDWMRLSAARGRCKIAVVDDAETLNTESSNAFLKTLEEPPPGSLLALVTSRTEDLLPTIVSRCQVVRFQALPSHVVQSVLEGPPHSVPADRAAFLARASGGRVDQALRLSDPAVWPWRAEVFKRMVGLPVHEALAVADAIHEFAQQGGKQSVKVRETAVVLLELLAALWRDAAAWLAGGGRSELLLSPDGEALVSGVGSCVDVDGAVSAVDRILGACDQIRRMANVRLALDAMCTDLARLQGGSCQPSAVGSE